VADVAATVAAAWEQEVEAGKLAELEELVCKCHRPCSGTTDKQRWSSQGPCTIPCNRQRKRRRIGRWRRCRRYNREAAAHVGELAAAVATVMVVAVEAVEANEVVVCRKHRPCTSTSHSGPMGR